MDSNIDKNVKEINNGTYGTKINDKAVGYKKGAIVGLILGVLTGMYFKQNLILFGVIGVVGGGYIGFKIAESSEDKNEFKNLGSNK
jgi:uncharacterized protein YcfJ